jgi:hypothetical protein
MLEALRKRPGVWVMVGGISLLPVGAVLWCRALADDVISVYGHDWGE